MLNRLHTGLIDFPACPAAQAQVAGWMTQRLAACFAVLTDNGLKPPGALATGEMGWREHQLIEIRCSRMGVSAWQRGDIEALMRPQVNSG